MTLQWTVVACFLYVEIFFIILLLLPWIRPHMWQKVFKSRLMRGLEAYSHIYSNALAGVLFLLFFDAIREVRKYTLTDEEAMKQLQFGANADAVTHMRLFRAQRNLYIAGFALFLWLVIRRLISLIQQEAHLMASAEAALKQAKNASQAAESMMGARGADDPEKKKLQSELEKLKKDLKQAEIDRNTMRKQAESLQQEYGRVADELAKVQGSGGNKKDA